MKLKNCRICKSESFESYLDLGKTPAADAFVKKELLNKSDPIYPLEVCLCNNCGISQLNFTVDPKILYQNDYPYESSTTQMGRMHFEKFGKSVFKKAFLNSNDLVVDIGSNVGVLLESYKKCGCKVLGIEPSKHIAKEANLNGVETINDFINTDLAKKIVSEKGVASVINITNVFAHINDLDDLMQAVDILLKDDGIFVIEAPHFLDLINSLIYDTIYHEHLLYLSVRPLNYLFNRFGFEIFDIGKFAIHGGSIRIFISKIGKHDKTENIEKIINLEEKAKLFDLTRLNEFSVKVNDHREKLRKILLNIKNEGKNIVAVSAPAKGMTLLNFCEIDYSLIDFITEKSKLKIGKYSPGAHIPIFSDDELSKQKPDYALLLAWNFADEIMDNLSDFKNSGGKFIIPMPEPKII